MNSACPPAILSRACVLIVGTARNCEKTIRSNVFRLQASFGGARQIHWFIVESDSTDKTLEVLAALEMEVTNFRFRSLGSLAGSIPSRVARLAHCRNVYLEELDCNPIYDSVDYLVVADLDGVNNLLTLEGVNSCFTRSDWDVCTANQRAPYYDIWALRHPTWSPNDCWKQLNFLLERGVQSEVALWIAVYGKMITIPESAAWIPVDSAFGGLGIYRRSILHGVRYAGDDENGSEVSEHVPLHTQIRALGARIFINPQLINTAVTEHVHGRSFRRILRQFVFGLLPQRAADVLRTVKKFLTQGRDSVNETSSIPGRSRSAQRLDG